MYDIELIQQVINRAVWSATRAAKNGHPIENIVWIPSQSATQDPLGCFAVTYEQPKTASETSICDLY